MPRESQPARVASASRRQGTERASKHVTSLARSRLHNLWRRLPVPAVQQIPTCTGSLPGGGIFPRYFPAPRLTAPERSRSVWRLPDCFEPRPETPTLSYHASAKRWSRDAEGILLRTVGRGQEFVLDCDSYPGVLDWLTEVFASARQ